jgi:ElaB/YqjD/DUF883 family membrane-anchored ribosome-binding protein
MDIDSRKESKGAEALEDASSRASAAAGRMAERGHRAIHKVASTAQNAAERIGAHSEEWMARGDEMSGEVGDYVRERPLVSLAMAAAVGFVLYRLVGGERERDRYVPGGWEGGYRGSGYSGDRASAAGGRMAEHGHRAMDKVASTAQNAAERIGAHSEEWMARGDEMTREVRDYVRERPLVSLAMAVAVGSVLYRLVSGGWERDKYAPGGSWERG